MEALRFALIEMYEYIYGTALYDSVAEWLDLGPNSPHYGNVWGAISAVYTAFKVIGILLCLIWFLTNLTEKSTRQEFTLETFARECVLMIFCCVLIDLGLDFVSGVSDFATGTMALLNQALTGVASPGASPGATELLEEAKNTVNEAGTMQLIALFLSNLIFFVVVQIEKILIIVAAMSRSVEFILYSMFFPWGVSDLYRNGGQSTGMRYIKKLVALAIQGAVIYAVVYICNVICGVVVMADQVQGMVYSLGLMTTTVALVFKANQYVDNIVGV